MWGSSQKSAVCHLERRSNQQLLFFAWCWTKRNCYGHLGCKNILASSIPGKSTNCWWYLNSIWSAISIMKSLSVWKTMQMALSFYVHAFCSQCLFTFLMVFIGLGRCTAEDTLPLLFLSLGFHPESWLNSVCLHVIRRDSTPEKSSWVPPGKAYESVTTAELTAHFPAVLWV